tara:strand:+ start:5952 stop:6122 length:171 start_codon:yes stop_codon:yes gene_type:complete
MTVTICQTYKVTGDVLFKQAAAGKLLTSLIAIIGLGIVAVPTGLFASALLKTVREK